MAMSVEIGLLMLLCFNGIKKIREKQCTNVHSLLLSYTKMCLNSKNLWFYFYYLKVVGGGVKICTFVVLNNNLLDFPPKKKKIYCFCKVHGH